MQQVGGGTDARLPPAHPQASPPSFESDTAALTICIAAPGGAPPGLRDALLSAALSDPAAAAARLPPAAAVQLARLAGAIGVESRPLAAALVDRIVAGGALGSMSSDKLALLAASVARMLGGDAGGESSGASEGTAEASGGGGGGGVSSLAPPRAPPGWDGESLTAPALRAFAGGRAGWGGSCKVRALTRISSLTDCFCTAALLAEAFLLQAGAAPARRERLRVWLQSLADCRLTAALLPETCPLTQQR